MAETDNTLLGHDAELVNPEEPQSLLAKALSMLSVKEREKATYDIHGVADLIEETPDFVDAKLTELDAELKSRIPDRSAIHQALEMDADYVQNRRNRIKFLRSTSFDVPATAAKMISHFQHKLDLFGVDKLTQDIGLADMNEEDLACLGTGFNQLLPMRDVRGRAILFHNPALRGAYSAEAKLRAIRYIAMAAAEDEEVQKRGVVFICYRTDPAFSSSSTGFDPVSGTRNGQLTQGLPIRIVSFHFCFDSSKFLVSLSHIMNAFNTGMQARVKVHQGTHQERQYTLMTFGIPITENVFPVSPEGIPTTDNHTMWLEQRAKSNYPPVNVVIPRPHDVLLGRDRTAQIHGGNVKYRQLLEENAERYNSASKTDKTAVAMDIVDKVKGSGGRFLKHENGVWEDVDDRTARVKVTMAFRSKRRTAAMKASSSPPLTLSAAPAPELFGEKRLLQDLLGFGFFQNNDSDNNNKRFKDSSDDASSGGESSVL